MTTNATPNLGFQYNIPAQLQPEVPLNWNWAMLDNLLPAAAAFGYNPGASSGLNFAYFGGKIYSNGANISIASGSVALAASATNYVQRTAAGVVSANTAGFTVGLVPMATVVTGASGITTVTDVRPTSADLRGRQVINIGAPTGVGVTTATTGGTLAASTTYAYRVSAVYPWGESAASAEVQVTTGSTTATNENAISWTLPTGATAAKVYGRTAGGELLIATVAAGTSSYTDTGAVTPSGALPTGTFTLGDAQVNSRILSFEGVLSAASVVNFPTYTQEWVLSDATTGSFALQVQATGSVSPITLTQGVASMVYGNGTDLVATGATGGGFANPMTSLGDLIMGLASGTPTRLAVGAQGQVLTVTSGASGLTVAWENNPAGFANPMTAAGDLILGSTSGTASRLPSGSIGQVLTSTGAGVAWSAPSSGNSGSALSVNAQTSGAYTLQLSDAPRSSNYQGVVTMNTASSGTVTVPTSGTVAWQQGTQIQVTQLGAGQTAVASDGTSVIRTPSSLTARAQYSSLVLTYLGSDVWVLGGDMT